MVLIENPPEMRSVVVQKDSKLFEDMARLASGAVGGVMDAKREVEAMLSAQVEKWLQKMQLVTREEYQVVQEMAAAARQEQESLRQRLDALERKIAEMQK